MSTLAVRTYQREQAAGHQDQIAARPLAGLATILHAFATWQKRRQTRKLLYGMEPRLLRDIGVDPAEIYDQYRGTVGELPGDRLRGFPAGRQVWRL